MRTSPRIISIFLNLALLGSIGSEATAFGQEVELALPENEPNGNSIPVSSLAFSPDGNLVATGHGMFLGLLQEPSPGETILWEPRSGKRVKTIPALKDGVHSLTFSPNGKTLAVLEFSGVIRLFAIPEGRELRKFDLNEKNRGFYSVAFFPNGEHLAAGIVAELGDPGNEILILDVASGKRIWTLIGHSGPVGALAVSPNGKQLASGADDSTVMIWNALTGKPVRTLTFPSLIKKAKKEEDECWVKSVAFSPDGQTLAAAARDIGSESAAVEFWDVSTAKSKANLKKIDPEIRQVVFSTDGKKLVTAGKEVKLWDAATFKESGAIEGGYWPIALSRDGKTAALTSSGRTVGIADTQKLRVFDP